MGKDKDSKPATLESLNQQLEAVKKLAPTPTRNAPLSGDSARSAIDFASATAVGTVLGYGFDVWQDSLPWGMLVGLLIGTAAGLKLMFQNEARARARSETDNANKP